MGRPMLLMRVRACGFLLRSRRKSLMGNPCAKRSEATGPSVVGRPGTDSIGGAQLEAADEVRGAAGRVADPDLPSLRGVVAAHVEAHAGGQDERAREAAVEDADATRGAG